MAELRMAGIMVPHQAEASIRLQVLGKGRKERVVYLCREAYQPLAAYLKAQPVSDRQQPVFPNR